MQNTPLKFIKFNIGTLSLRVLNLRTGSVIVSIHDVTIDVELQDKTFFSSELLVNNVGSLFDSSSFC